MTSKWLALALETVGTEEDLTPSVSENSSLSAANSANSANRPETFRNALIANGLVAEDIGTVENADCANSPDIAPITGHWAFVAACEAALRNGPLPDMPDRRWRSFLVDAPRLCADWSETAHALGWQPKDFYGHNSAAPWARVDALGLAYLLDGQMVIAMDGRQARLTHLSFYRHQKA